MFILFYLAIQVVRAFKAYQTYQASSWGNHLTFEVAIAGRAAECQGSVAELTSCTSA